MGPYRKGGPVVASCPAVAGTRDLAGHVRGVIYCIHPASGEPSAVARLGTPIAAQLVNVGDDVVAVTIDGIVRRLKVEG